MACECENAGKILVAGSLAFDVIMNYEGKFSDHILPDRLDAINLSFLVNRSRKERGGCSGNVAYSLALLGEKPRIVASAGRDFSEYMGILKGLGVDTSYIRIFDDEYTATCTITSDKTNNQMTFVCVGAMARARELSLKDAATPATKIAIISPDDPEAMKNHTAAAREAGIPFIFDPSFQVIAFDGETLMQCADGAKVLIVNDYEFSLFMEKTGCNLDELRKRIELIVVTRGGDGSTIYSRDGAEINVPSAKIKGVADPTGAGDAFRSGLIYGLLRDRSLEECAKLGNICGAYAVEAMGTQNFHYTREEFSARYKENYGTEAPL